jgi:hypothetical protein
VHRLLFRLADASRILGIKKLLWVGLLWLARPEYIVLVRDLQEPVPEPPPAASCVRWTVFTEADIPRVLALNSLDSEAGLRRRLKTGQEGLLGWVGDSLAYYRWDVVGPTRLHALCGTVELREGDLLTLLAFTQPRLRGQGLHGSSTSIVLRRARERGLRRAITFVAWWNRPALRVAEVKAGRERVGTIGWCNVSPWRHIVATGDVRLAQDGTIQIA